MTKPRNRQTKSARFTPPLFRIKKGAINRVLTLTHTHMLNWVHLTLPFASLWFVWSILVAEPSFFLRDSCSNIADGN
jgi:hypothetical protein